MQKYIIYKIVVCFLFNYYKTAFNAVQRGRRHLTQRATRRRVDSVRRNPSQRSRQGGELSRHPTSSCCPEIESTKKCLILNSSSSSFLCDVHPDSAVESRRERRRRDNPGTSRLSQAPDGPCPSSTSRTKSLDSRFR